MAVLVILVGFIRLHITFCQLPGPDHFIWSQHCAGFSLSSFAIAQQGNRNLILIDSRSIPSFSTHRIKLKKRETKISIYFIIGFRFFSWDFDVMLDFYLFFQLKPFQGKKKRKKKKNPKKKASVVNGLHFENRRLWSALEVLK